MSTPVRLGAGFWRVWSASTVSELGSGLTYVALPLLTVTLTRDARLVSLVGAAQALPFLLFGLQSGAVADRLDRRRIMWATDVLRAALTALLVLLVITGPLTVGVLCGLAFALGAADILFLNASAAIIPDLVAPEGLERANAWLGSAQVVASSFVGLPLGALVFGLSRSAPFAVDAGSFAIAAALVLALRGSFRSVRTGTATMRQDVREGVVWLWGHQLLRALALLLAVINAAFAAGEVVLVLYALEDLHAGRLGYSLLLGVLALGSVVGGAATPSLRGRFGVRPVIGTAAALMALGVLVPGVTTRLPLVLLGLFAAGVGTLRWNVSTITLRQQLVPAEMLGRVTSAYRLVGLGAMPLGAVAGGLVGHAVGLRAVYLLAGAVLALAVVVALPRLRTA